MRKGGTDSDGRYRTCMKLTLFAQEFLQQCLGENNLFFSMNQHLSGLHVTRLNFRTHKVKCITIS